MASRAQAVAGRGRLALVTGGAGFIGSHLVEELLSHDWRVRVLDDLSTGSEENLAGLSAADLVRGDVADPEAVAEAAGGVEVVFHQAAIASVPRSIVEPFLSHRVNLGGTLAVLEGARARGCRRVVFASSSAVYGAATGEPVRESAALDPLSPYAAQKLASEHYLRIHAALHGIETVSLRYFNVYGPRQDPASDYAAVIPLFASAALRGETLHVHGDGRQTRDFVHVSDVARANRLAADAAGVSGRGLNLASGRSIRILDLVAALEAALGRRLDVVHEAPRAGDVRHSAAVVDAARESLGFEPGVDFETGIRHTIEALGVASAARGASQ